MSRVTIFEEFLEEVLPELEESDYRSVCTKSKWEFHASAFHGDNYMVADARSRNVVSIPVREIQYLTGTQWWPDERAWEKEGGRLFRNVPDFLTLEQIPKVLDNRNPSLLALYFEYLRWRLVKGV